jgi:hypothetical protein
MGEIMGSLALELTTEDAQNGDINLRQRTALTLTKPDPLMLKIIDPSDAQLFVTIGMRQALFYGAYPDFQKHIHEKSA